MDYGRVIATIDRLSKGVTEALEAPKKNDSNSGNI